MTLWSAARCHWYVVTSSTIKCHVPRYHFPGPIDTLTPTQYLSCWTSKNRRFRQSIPFHPSRNIVPYFSRSKNSFFFFPHPFLTVCAGQRGPRRLGAGGSSQLASARTVGKSASSPSTPSSLAGSSSKLLASARWAATEAMPTQRWGVRRGSGAAQGHWVPASSRRGRAAYEIRSLLQTTCRQSQARWSPGDTGRRCAALGTRSGAYAAPLPWGLLLGLDELGRVLFHLDRPVNAENPIPSAIIVVTWPQNSR